MNSTKTHREYRVTRVSVSSGDQKNSLEAISSFLAKCGFESTENSAGEICNGARPKAGEEIFFECDSEEKLWYKLSRESRNQRVEIDSGTNFSISRDTDEKITVIAKAKKISGKWHIECHPKGKNGKVPLTTAPPTAAVILPPAPKPLSVEAAAPSNPLSTATPRTFAIVKVSSIRPFAKQPRKYFNQESIDSLKDGIIEIGLLQPFTVRRLLPSEKVAGENYEYELVDGERRWRAVQLVGLTDVEVVIEERELTPALQFAISFAMNHNKEYHTLGEIVGGLVRMTEDGLTQLQITKMLCKSPSWVNQHLSLRHLHPNLIELLDPPIPEEKRLRFGDARNLVRIENADEQLKIYRDACEHSSNPKIIGNYIKKAVTQHKDRKTSPWKTNSVRSLSRFNERVDADLLVMEQMTRDVASFLRAARSESFKDSLLLQLRAHAKRFSDLADTINLRYEEQIEKSNGNGFARDFHEDGLSKAVGI